jgi:hypothetical protein
MVAAEGVDVVSPPDGGSVVAVSIAHAVVSGCGSDRRFSESVDLLLISGGTWSSTGAW